MKSYSLLLAAAAAVSLGPPAGAATFFGAIAQPPASGGSPGGCITSADGGSSSSPIRAKIDCGGANGTAGGRASATFGHVGADANVASLQANTVPVIMEAAARFAEDSVIFTSADPNAQFASVAANFVFSGRMAVADGFIFASHSRGPGIANLDAALRLGDGNFALSRGTSTSGNGLNMGGFTILSGSMNGEFLNAMLRSPTVVVPLNTPVFFQMSLNTRAASSGAGGSAVSDFGSSFELPTGQSAFFLPTGVTANAGSWLVNNRLVGANAGTVPEPAAWAMMILGFGMIGFGFRRRVRSRLLPA